MCGRPRHSPHTPSEIVNLLGNACNSIRSVALIRRGRYETCSHFVFVGKGRMNSGNINFNIIIPP